MAIRTDHSVWHQATDVRAGTAIFQCILQKLGHLHDGDWRGQRQYRHRLDNVHAAAEVIVRRSAMSHRLRTIRIGQRRSDIAEEEQSALFTALRMRATDSAGNFAACGVIVLRWDKCLFEFVFFQRRSGSEFRVKIHTEINQKIK